MAEDLAEDPKRGLFGKGFEATKAVLNKGKDIVAPYEIPEALKTCIIKGVGASDNLLRTGINSVAKHAPDGSKAFLKKSWETTAGICKAGKAFNLIQGNNLKAKITANGRVIVGYKNAKSAIFRLDIAHPGADFNHININPKFSGLAKDPHLALPPGGLALGRVTTRVCQFMNKANDVLIPVTIAVDVLLIGASILEDHKKETTRNTVETAAKIAGVWTGGFGGIFASKPN